MTRRTRPVFLLLLGVLLALTASLGFFFFRDNFATHYPIKVLSASALRAGEIPWWNFNDGGGQPLAGNPNTLTFYPDNFLYLLLPAHVAFNLHFLIHLILGWIAMRSLTRSRFGAWLWVLSGAAMSACAFYNLIPTIALIPLAFLGAERRSAVRLALAFGLLALAGEPVVIAATAIGVAVLFGVGYARGFGRAQPGPTNDGKNGDGALPDVRCRGESGGAINRVPRRAGLRPAEPIVAALFALVIALPQLIAYGEIAREVERAHRFSAATVLNASFDPRRVLELVIGPVMQLDAPHLFPSLVIGIVALPAIFRRSRYTLVAGVSLFFALGAFNPLVRIAVESFATLRIVRFPEKFALVLCAALVVLVSDFMRESKTLRIWAVVTFVPLLFWCARTLPIDWFAPYALPAAGARRVFVASAPGGQQLDRDEYRERARRHEPLFGATAGLEYVLNRSPDGMHSLLSRIAAERFAATHNRNWLRLALALPRIVPYAPAARTVTDAVNLIESGADAVAPREMVSADGARVMRVAREGQTITIDVAANGPSLLATDQTFFSAWSARMNGAELEIVPLNLDRLGVIVPRGGTVTLRFGRHRTAVVIAWSASLLLIAALCLALRIEKLDRSTGEVQRSGDDDRVVA